MRETLDSEVPARLRGQHHRCAAALDRLRAPAPDLAPRDLEPAARQTLRALRESVRIVLGTRAEPAAGVPAVRFMDCRLDRLEIAADDLATAPNATVLRHHALRFHALATATWWALLAINRSPHCWGP
jgi:hypothetical protein